MTNFLQMKRRQFLPRAAAFGSLAGLGFHKSALAGMFPSQPINFLIPYGPGGGFDTYARKFSLLLQNNLTPHVNVEPLNEPGASGEKAVFTILQSPPDGYNISLINIPGVIESKYSKKASNIDIDQLTWLATLGRETYGIAASAKGDVHTVADLKKLSSQRPVSFGSTGPGSTDYFATKIFSSAVGLRTRQVMGYNGAVETAVGVARGDVDCVVHSLTVLKQMQTAGMVRIIFTFQDKSSLPGIEDASTLNQPDLGKIYQWFPVIAPPKLPQEIATMLSDALVNAANSDDAKAWANTIHTTLYPLNQQQTLQMVQEQTALVARWKDVIQ